MSPLDDYQAHIHLSEGVRSLRTEARSLAPQLEGRTVWMVNSTARGGGVAEMMPRMITIFRELGVDVRWAVIGSDNPGFFRLTKRLHNLIHGSGDPALTAADRDRVRSRQPGERRGPATPPAPRGPAGRARPPAARLGRHLAPRPGRARRIPLPYRPGPVDAPDAGGVGVPEAARRRVRPRRIHRAGVHPRLPGRARRHHSASHRSAEPQEPRPARPAARRYPVQRGARRRTASGGAGAVRGGADAPGAGRQLRAGHRRRRRRTALPPHRHADLQVGPVEGVQAVAGGLSAPEGAGRRESPPARGIVAGWRRCGW